MDKETFANNLRLASQSAVEFTSTMVVNEMPSEYRYLIYPNCSNDINPIRNDEERFPEDSLVYQIKGFVGPVDATEVVHYLWRNDKIPQWIDVIALVCDENYTHLELSCCGRFVGSSRRLYHEKRGTPPFFSLSVAISGPNFEYHNKQRFNLNWRTIDPAWRR